MDGLFSTHYGFNNIPFDYLKAYHQISLDPDVEQTLMLLTSNIPFFNLPVLNLKMAEKSLSGGILDEVQVQFMVNSKRHSTHGAA